MAYDLSALGFGDPSASLADGGLSGSVDQYAAYSPPTPMAANYSTGAATSSNGVNWSGIADSLGSAAKSAASIYSTVSASNAKPVTVPTGTVVINPQTGAPVVAKAASSTNWVVIAIGVVVFGAIAFFAFFRGKK